MKCVRCFFRLHLLLLLLLTLSRAADTPQAPMAAVVLYETGFEISDGFNLDLPLSGQSGWTNVGTGGNGLVTEFFPGLGQQAFLGFAPPASNDVRFVNLFRPINYAPFNAGLSLVKFSTRMQIVASTNGHSDDFRWSVYNTNAARLFSLDFDTRTLDISYSLDQPTDFVPTFFRFDTLGTYDLTIWMDFGRNLWTALLEDIVIVNSQPISATGANLNLGDIDPVWAIQDPSIPGDNYMLFDNYQVTVETVASVPPRLEVLGVGANKAMVVRVYGQAGLNYAIEDTLDMVQWEMVKIFQAPVGGVFDFEDPGALETPHRIFRVKQAP